MEGSYFVSFLLLIPIISGEHVHMRIPKTPKQSNPISTDAVRDNLVDKFWKVLYPEVINLQSKTSYDVLDLYTRETILQAHQVAENVREHANLTRLQSEILRKTVNSSQDISNCTVQVEIGLLNAFKQTGYNVHNCVRNVQMNFEQKYAEFNRKLEQLKEDIVRGFYFYNNTLENCADKHCPLNLYVQAVTRFEILRDNIRKLTIEVTDIHKKYIMSSIAMGCVQNAFEQVRQNYKIGQNLLEKCINSP